MFSSTERNEIFIEFLEVHSELSQTFKIDLFAKIVSGWKLLTIFVKGSILNAWLALREKCPYSEIFWSIFSRIWTEYGEGEMLRISQYSVRMRENTDQKNSEYGHFLRSVGTEYVSDFL